MDIYDDPALKEVRRQEDEIKRLCEWSGLKQLEEYERAYEISGLKQLEGLERTYEMSGLRQLEECKRIYKNSSTRQLEEMQRGLREMQGAFRPSHIAFFEGLQRTVRQREMDFFSQVKRIQESFSRALYEQVQSLSSSYLPRNLENVFSISLRFKEMQSLYSTEKLFTSALNSMRDSIRLQPLQFQAEIQNVWESLGDFNQMIHDFAPEDVVVNHDSTVTISGNVVTAEEVHGIVKEALDSSGLLTESNFFEGIRTLTAEARNENATSVRKNLLIAIILFFLQFVLQPLVQPQIENFYEKVFPKIRRPAVHLIKKETLKSVDDPFQLSNIRFVSKDMLFVMRNNNRRSQVVGKLYFGNAVLMIHKKKNWSLVEWSNGESVLRGWVFTRYLERFN